MEKDAGILITREQVIFFTLLFRDDPTCCSLTELSSAHTAFRRPFIPPPFLGKVGGVVAFPALGIVPTVIACLFSVAAGHFLSARHVQVTVESVEVSSFGTASEATFLNEKAQDLTSRVTHDRASTGDGLRLGSTATGGPMDNIYAAPRWARVGESGVGSTKTSSPAWAGTSEGKDNKVTQ